jgi:hypothetical protein
VPLLPQRRRRGERALGERTVTRRIAMALAALVTLGACTALHFATTPNQLAACCIAGMTGLMAFVIVMDD